MIESARKVCAYLVLTDHHNEGRHDPVSVMPSLAKGPGNVVQIDMFFDHDDHRIAGLTGRLRCGAVCPAGPDGFVQTVHPGPEILP
ncbi:hypothetical protein [Streptomyces sp. NPDC090445]|uniref:hypothetical protein n=1 Tax=Streptomyces sp. NPDC090445 TaxID=3365963 RepID=UPI0038015A9F